MSQPESVASAIERRNALKLAQEIVDWAEKRLPLREEQHWINAEHITLARALLSQSEESHPLVDGDLATQRNIASSTVFNPLHWMRKIRACEGEVAAQLALEQAVEIALRARSAIEVRNRARSIRGVR